MELSEAKKVCKEIMEWEEEWFSVCQGEWIEAIKTVLDKLEESEARLKELEG